MGRPNGQVKVIGHQAKAADGHRDLDTGMAQRLEEGLIVILCEEDRTLAIAAVEYVVANAADRSAWNACHAGRLYWTGAQTSIVNVPVPFSGQARWQSGKQAVPGMAWHGKDRFRHLCRVWRGWQSDRQEPIRTHWHLL